MKPIFAASITLSIATSLAVATSPSREGTSSSRLLRSGNGSNASEGRNPLPHACAPSGVPLQTPIVSGLNVAGFSSQEFSSCLSNMLHGTMATYIPHKMVTEPLIRTYKRSSTPPTLVGPPQTSFLIELIDGQHALPLQPSVQSMAEAMGLPIFTHNATAYSFKDSVESVKSLVFYRTDLFSEYNLTVPTTLEAFEDLISAISDLEAAKPFCLSIYSGNATGWVGTDWTENYILAKHGAPTIEDWVHKEYVNDEYVADANDWVKEHVIAHSDSERNCEAWTTQIEDLQDGRSFMTLTLSSRYFEAGANEDDLIAWFEFPGTDQQLIVGNSYTIAFTNEYLSSAEKGDRKKQVNAYYNLSLTSEGASMKMVDGSAKRGEVSLVPGVSVAQSGVPLFKEFATLVRNATLVYDPTDRMQNYEDHWKYWKDELCPTA